MDEVPSNPSFRALILEDQEFQRHIGVQVLIRCGASEVLQASDGATALDLIGADTFSTDVMLCDLNMPGMDGLAFLRHIAERGCTSSVILASALDPSIIRAAEIMAKSYGIRLIGAVDKPVSRAKLMPLLLRHFSQHLIKPRAQVGLQPLDEIVVALERRQFEPYFQPKVNMRTGTLVGVEALMRWRHPELGLLGPATFIPVMETNGLISQATFDIFETALAQRQHWSKSGIDLSVAINVSTILLRDTGLPDRLEALAKIAGVAPSALVLEVTETSAMTDLGHSLETLARCRMKGFELSIDDYGTGFSSMQQLTRLPLSELKIDQSFVTGAANEAVLMALIETSVAMAQRLNLRTVAEGVETSDDWDIVARLGCDLAQGYLIARPMPGEQVTAWYASWRGRRHGAPPDARMSGSVDAQEIL